MRGNDQGGLVVQERDRHLLRELGVMRVIDREQAKVVAGFGSTTRANVRLLNLTRAGLLRRFFLGTTAGGAKALYALSTKGAHLVDVVPRAPRRRTDQALVADAFVEHQLAVNDLYCSLKYGTAPIAGVRFRRWLGIYEPLRPGLRLIPDGYVEFDTPAGPVAAFIEVDLGHEGLTVWKEKVRNYLQYALSGNVARQFGPQQFRVLVLAPSERRRDSIRRTVLASTEKIFWFATLDSIHRHGFFAPVWFRPKGDEPQPFLRATP